MKLRAHPGLQFFPQKRFEEVEHNVENYWLVNDVDSLDSCRYSVLKKRKTTINNAIFNRRFVNRFSSIQTRKLAKSKNARSVRTCSQSTIRLAYGGLNCQVCCSDRPSMSKITCAPHIWVAGSMMAASRNITAPLYTSSNEHFLCFHFSGGKKKSNKKNSRSQYVPKAHTHTSTTRNRSLVLILSKTGIWFPNQGRSDNACPRLLDSLMKKKCVILLRFSYFDVT